MTTRSVLLTILNIISAIVGLTLGARVLVRLFAVNQSVPIIKWLMDVSESLVFPFRGLLSDISLSASSVIDLTAIIALIIYAIIFSLVYRLIVGITGRFIETDARLHTHSI